MAKPRSERSYACSMCTSPLPIPFDSRKELNSNFVSTHRDIHYNSTYVCSVCYFSCNKQKNVKKNSMSRLCRDNAKHLKHEIEKRCPVPGCGYFNTWEDYRNHIKDCHTNNTGTHFHCFNASSLCSFVSYTPWSWHTHVTKKLKVFCDTCQRIFKTTDALQRHLGNNHFDLPVWTKKSQKRVSPTRNLPSPAPGQVTSKIQTRNQFQSAVEGVMKVGKTKTYKCPICPGKIFKSEPAYANHLKKIHSLDVPKFSCKACGTGFKLRKVRDRHVERTCPKLREEEKNTTFRCEQCIKPLIGCTRYRNHMTRVHGKQNLLTCDQCQYEAPNLIDYHAHVRQHPPTARIQMKMAVSMLQRERFTTACESIEIESGILNEFFPKHEIETVETELKFDAAEHCQSPFNSTWSDNTKQETTSIEDKDELLLNEASEGRIRKLEPEEPEAENILGL